MFDLQLESSTGNTINSGNTYTTIDVTVPTGRVAVAGGHNQLHSGSNSPRAQMVATYPLNSTSWRFVFWNSSGSTDTIDCYVSHVPESDEVSVLRVKP